MLFYEFKQHVSTTWAPLKKLLPMLVILFLVTEAGAQNILSNNSSSAQWEEDINEFVRSLEMIHPNPYFRYNKEAFYADVADFKSNLNQLNEDERVLQLIKLVASLQDGHTHIPMHQEAFNFSALPIRVFLFDDGLYITRSKSDPALKGKKVLKIGSRTSEELFNEFQKIIPADNIYHAKNVFPFQVIISQFLFGLNATNNQEEISVSVLDDDQIQEVKLKTISLHEFFQWAFSPEHDESLPLYRQRPHDIYWQEYLEEDGILYMKYNQVISSSDYPIGSFVNDLDSLLIAKKADKLAIDLRDNPGGNKFTMTRLINLLKNHSINQPGKLFLISGRRSNSAATSFITSMKMETNAIQVGEPTGGSPNYYSDVRTITLPNSKINIAISTQYQRDSFYEDDRRSHFPEISVPLLSKTYFDNEDPFLNAIQSYNKVDKIDSYTNDNADNRILGRYRFSANQVLEIKEENGDLFAIINNLLRKKIFQKEDQVFNDVEDFIVLKFSPDFNELNVISSGFSKVIEKMLPNELTPIEKIEHGKVSEGIDEIETLLSIQSGEEILPESELNRTGYMYLRQHNLQEAIDLFELNTKLYPKSANVYDSLGEGFWESKDLELALKNYEKSLELNPGNTNAKEMLKKIKATMK